MNLYVANELHLLVLVVGAIAVVLFVVAGLAALVNLVAGRRLLRPWLWGTLAAACWFAMAVAYHFVMVYRMRAQG
jgi:uncharacterized RDD family membrane protein YckC